MPKHDFLHDIRVASPCKANWNEMSGDEKARFCGQCKLNVYNLSAMTKDEAQELIQQREGRLCVRFYRRSDGTVLTRDCPKGLAAIRFRIAGACAAVVAVFAGVGSYVFNCIQQRDQYIQGRLQVRQEFMGDIATPVQQTGINAVQGSLAPPVELGKLQARNCQSGAIDIGTHDK